MGTCKCKGRGRCKTDAGQLLAAIAAEQRAPVEAGDEKPQRPVLSGRGLLAKVGTFVARTLANKASYKALLQARDKLAESARPLFEAACEQAGELLTAADLPGGTIADLPERGELLEVLAGDVQWQCQVEAKDVEIGTDAEKLLNAAARRLMPEGFRLVLAVDLVSPKEREELLADLGEERIRRWFKVRHVRSAPDPEAVRALWGRGAAARKTLKALQAAKAIVIKQFPKLIARTGNI